MPQTFNVGARSRLVTALGWLALAWALLSGLTGLLSLWPAWGGWADAVWARWSGAERAVLGLALLLVAAGLLVSAVGLLRRLEWARRLFVLLLLVGMAVPLGSLLLQPADVLGQAGTALGLGSLGLCLLMGWLAWRLQQPLVRHEFA